MALVEIVAKAIYEWFRERENKALIARLKKLLRIVSEKTTHKKRTAACG